VPVAARHEVAAVAKASAGQVIAVPLQTSATSHGPADARHDVPDALGPVATHTATPVVHEVVPFWQAFAVAHATPGMQVVAHTPAALQLPPVQAVPTGAYAFAGQDATVPLQSSAGSQVPVEARQEKPDARSVSAGHAAAVPVHISATSQVPAAARHVTEAAAKAFAGQVVAVPLQVSATSHPPAAAARQTVAEAAVTVPQVPLAPPVSAAVHA
jgi:hypothetical protein